MAGNTTTKKKFNDVAGSPQKGFAPKSAASGNYGPKYTGEIGESEKYAKPMDMGVPGKIGGMEGLHDDIGEKSGFITDGYQDKNGTPYGESAKFNYLPPGMDISNQENAEIHTMPLRKLVHESYPGDGWMPAPRDIQE